MTNKIGTPEELTNESTDKVIHSHAGDDGVYLEMAQLATYNQDGKNDKDSEKNISLWVHGETNRPQAHFHFYRGKVPKGGKGGGCILIKKESFWPHDTHLDTMKPKEMKQLVEFLKSTDSDSGLTVWKLIVVSWNTINYNFKIDPDTKMPDYTNMVPYKESVDDSDDEPITEMADIWNPNEHEGLDLDVYSGEEPNNHFHLKGPKKFFVKGTPADTCISISQGKYFHHGQHQGVLNADGKKRLIRYLKQISKADASGNNNWQVAALMWNVMNMNQPQVSNRLEDMPDYSQL